MAIPVGVDATSAIPKTLRSYHLRGTPSWVLFDRNARIRRHHFGGIDDLQPGSRIGRLLSEAPTDRAKGCELGQCAQLDDV